MKKSLLALAVLSAMSLSQTALAAWHYDVEDTSSIEGLTDGDTVFGHGERSLFQNVTAR